MMTQVKPLTAAFGMDRRAYLIAESMNVTLSWSNIQKVMAILKAWNAAYRGPLIPQISKVTDLRVLMRGALPQSPTRRPVNSNAMPTIRGSGMALSR